MARYTAGIADVKHSTRKEELFINITRALQRISQGLFSRVTYIHIRYLILIFYFEPSVLSAGRVLLAPAGMDTRLQQAVVRQMGFNIFPRRPKLPAFLEVLSAAAHPFPLCFIILLTYFACLHPFASTEFVAATDYFEFAIFDISCYFYRRT